MSGLRLLPLGTGDAFSAERYSFCLALEAEGRWLLIDCPHPARKMLREGAVAAGLSVDVGDVDAVVVTHLHADHASGLETFGWFSRFVLGRRARLLAHPAVGERLWEGSLAAGMERLLTEDGERELGFDEVFSLEPLHETAAARCGPFELECHRTVHHIPTTALRVRASGRTLGISSDTAFDEGLLAWLLESDLVVHECGYGVAHTPYEALAQLPSATREKMRLVHYPDELDLEASVIEPLRQGRLYEV